MNREEIKAKINSNPLESEGYIAYGDFLCESNPKQAYLCYENALFFSKDDSEKKLLTGKIDSIVKDGNAVKKASIIILSYNLREDVKILIESIRNTTPDTAREIVVVDNASVDDSVEYLKIQSDIKLRVNTENVGFPKGCNQGIEMSDPESDIFLLNNDTVMMDNTLFWLRMGLYEDESIGATGCVTNNIFGIQKICEAWLELDWYREFAAKTNLYIDEPLRYVPFLVGFALLVKRNVVDEIGVLDEAFTPGNYEDNDYCARIWEAGYKTAIVQNSFLVHVGGKTFRKRADYAETLHRNKVFFENKHGIEDSDSMMHPDSTMQELFSNYPECPDNAQVLEINCILGTFLLDLKYKHPEYSIEGISTREVTKKYACKTDKVKISTFDEKKEYVNYLGNKKYDVVILRISIEDDMGIDFYYNLMTEHVKENGRIFIALDNISHFSNWLPLMKGKIAREINKKSVTVEQLMKKLNAEYNISLWVFAYKPHIDIDVKLKDELIANASKFGINNNDLTVDTFYIIVQKA